MKKTHKQRKRQRIQRIRKIIIHAIIQVLIVAMMIGFKHQSRFATLDNTKQITVTVDRTAYDPGGIKIDPKFFVYAGSESYRFSSGATEKHGYLIRELQNRVHTGDMLTITYMETYLITGKKNMVVEASNGPEVLYTIADYNNSYKGSNMYIPLLFVLLEAGVWFMISLQEGWFFTWVAKGRISNKSTTSKNR